ncbi:putative C6 finger domain protein [Aspergillus campestris IBT 28561]|uniref:C6 finger domain protein n=1 Tax=Aspergillus campestris (strain IBT 28561) TaxID=1392248 RepID=A0A2I1CTT9_ASPC2|nr:putative C6 finger domain protein [Aspergillus campestris IBT 28561]PKY01038.1 putative C6 finger domain protein [Aspergillus campestris IBT 28561]
MPGVPSNKACERCKKRHLKCDETRPRCQRCINAGVECPGYVQTRKFIDQGASVRRRYAPYRDHPKSNSVKPHDPPSGDHGFAQNEEQHPIQPPEIGLSVSTTWGSETTQSGPPSPMPNASLNSAIVPEEPVLQPRVEATSSIASPEQQQSGSNHNVSQPSSGQSHTAEMTTSLSGPQEIRPPPNPRLGSYESPSMRSDREDFQDIFSELMTGTEHELSFLIRHYSDTVGPWLDLADSGNFFAAYVPIRAINEPFLRYSVAALAAKHLGRVKGQTLSAAGGLFSSPATMEVYPNSEQVDWTLKAANYFYLAVTTMNSHIVDQYTFVSSSAVLESPIAIVNRWLTAQTKATQPLEPGAFWRMTENLVAAAAILTMYRLIDESALNWQSHLDGIQTLYDYLLGLCSNGSEPARFSHGIAAAFWNFSRQDYQASYYNRLPSHFDPANLPLWRAAGIAVGPDGSLELLPPSDPASHREDTAANTLTWLLCKVVNFLAESKKSQMEQFMAPLADETSPSCPSPHSYPTTSTWLRLSFDLQTWFENVPETFRPSVRLETKTNTDMPFPEIFYGLTTCASAMQQYHFGRLGLSLNRPADAVTGLSTAFDRLQGYRELTKEVDYRCKEIAGIALARPGGGARIYMIPLLFAIGQCFEGAQERQIIGDLLRGVEADMGWATQVQIERLQALWAQRQLV